jgi:PAS domain S-box-containing protein
MSGSEPVDRAYIEQLESALSASEERYRSLFEDDTAGRFIATPAGRICDSNRSLAALLGFQRADQLLGRQLRGFFHDPNQCDTILESVASGARVDAMELALTRQDGDPINVVMWVAPTGSEGAAAVAVRGRLFDVTEFERLKVRLLGARRMEAIGRLTGGIAHEFNNLLSVIDGHAERLVETLTPNDPLTGSALAIQKSARRAASLTNQLLAFGRRQLFQWQVVNVPQIVRDTLPALRRVLGERIDARLELSDVPEIRIDPAQLEHAIINLALNAREAMPDGGSFTIVVDTLDVGGNDPNERPYVRPGRHVRLRVGDSGVGMDAATKAHAFEPFFTTKAVGHGTGLGLATVYGIVKQSGGYIWVESEVGAGTTFTLLFPSAVSEDERARTSSARSANETVLVVEPDAGVRAVMVESLSRQGYRVLDAPTPTAARETREAFGSRIHLLISEIDGDPEHAIALTRWLKADDALIQVLYVTDPSRNEARGTLGGAPHIEKPFTQRALIGKVREVLDSGEA